MSQSALIQTAAVILLGGLAQWIGTVARVPSILLLLAFGFVAGPVARNLAPGWSLEPDALFGNLLLPFVALAVALILFEGGLNLSFREIRGVRGVVALLVTAGAVATGILAAAAAGLTLGLSFELTLLLGAILTVTGPTVVLPLLRHIKPAGRVAAVLKWEGIVVDPVGALLAVLVFEVVTGHRLDDPVRHAGLAVLTTLVIGGGLGAAGALVLVAGLRSYWVPDHLQNPIATMLVVAAYVGANQVQAESGLLAVTVMGIVLANQRAVSIRSILEFKENLRVLLLSTVFILLSARMTVQDLASVGPGVAVFIAALILVVRPLSVALSTAGSRLSWRERAFVAWMAPRGIVAAAVTSVFALALEKQGLREARLLVPVMFTTIVATVIVYGLSGSTVARWLGLSDRDPQGFLIVGAHALARDLARCLAAHDIRTLLVDTNRAEIDAARAAGLSAVHASILADDVPDRLDLAGIGRLLALTANDEVNVLATERFAPLFGRANVYRLPPKGSERGRPTIERHAAGRVAFRADLTMPRLSELVASGARVTSMTLTDPVELASRRGAAAGDPVLLVVVPEPGRAQLVVAGDRPTPRPGHVVIMLARDASQIA